MPEGSYHNDSELNLIFGGDVNFTDINYGGVTESRASAKVRNAMQRISEIYKLKKYGISTDTHAYHSTIE